MSDENKIVDDETESGELVFKDQEERVKFYSEKLTFLWGKYLTLVHLIISLSGATVLVFFNSIKLGELDKYVSTWSACVAVIAAGLALISSIGWRLTAQYFMEREVFGSRPDAEEYYKLVRPHDVATTYKKHERRVVHWLYKVVPFPSILLLVASWILLLFFIMRNT